MSEHHYKYNTLEGLREALEDALTLVNSGSPKLAQVLIEDYLAESKKAKGEVKP